jgi:hypothetical protein
MESYSSIWLVHTIREPRGFTFCCVLAPIFEDDPRSSGVICKKNTLYESFTSLLCAPSKNWVTSYTFPVPKVYEKLGRDGWKNRLYHER